MKPDSRWGQVDPHSTLTYKGQSSLIEVLKSQHCTEPHPLLHVTYEQAVGTATVFVSFAYASDFVELVDAVERYMRENQELSVDRTYFWFDV